MTKIVHIVPRFVIQNYLGVPVFIRQSGKSNIECIESEESTIYNFESKKAQQQNIQISLDEYLDAVWSAPFDISEPDDFQVGCKISESEISEMQQKELEKTRVLNKSSSLNIFGNSLAKVAQDKRVTTWYMPTGKNGYIRCVRVIVISEDDATKYINLLNPKEPEFVIKNATGFPLQVMQVPGGTKETELQANDELPYLFENHLKKLKKVKVTVEG